MTANWSKSNRSWRGRDRQRLGLAKQGGVLAQVFDGEQTRTAVVAFLLLASLHLYLAGLFQRLAPEPYMVRARVSRRRFGRAWGANRRQPRPSAPSAGALGRGWQCSCARDVAACANGSLFLPGAPHHTRGQATDSTHHLPNQPQDEYFHEKQTRAYCNGQWGALWRWVHQPPWPLDVGEG
jgi:hypothetical protein